MEIKCIALDLDRTTLDGDGYLPEENRLVLEEIMEKGVQWWQPAEEPSPLCRKPSEK